MCILLLSSAHSRHGQYLRFYQSIASLSNATSPFSPSWLGAKYKDEEDIPTRRRRRCRRPDVVSSTSLTTYTTIMHSRHCETTHFPHQTKRRQYHVTPHNKILSFLLAGGILVGVVEGKDVPLFVQYNQPGSYTVQPIFNYLPCFGWT